MEADGNMIFQGQSASSILEQLVAELGMKRGPLEWVIGEWQGSDVDEALVSIDRGVVRQRALEVIEELGATWGPTGDPSCVDGVVPGRPDDRFAPETDYMFSLYWRAGTFAYVRLRGDTSNRPSSMKLILGVLRS